jgi:hypothetical protein
LVKGPEKEDDGRSARLLQAEVEGNESQNRFHDDYEEVEREIGRKTKNKTTFYTGY